MGNRIEFGTSVQSKLTEILYGRQFNGTKAIEASVWFVDIYLNKVVSGMTNDKDSLCSGIKLELDAVNYYIAERDQYDRLSPDTKAFCRIVLGEAEAERFFKSGRGKVAYEPIGDFGKMKFTFTPYSYEPLRGISQAVEDIQEVKEVQKRVSKEEEAKELVKAILKHYTDYWGSRPEGDEVVAAILHGREYFRR